MSTRIILKGGECIYTVVLGIHPKDDNLLISFQEAKKYLDNISKTVRVACHIPLPTTLKFHHFLFLF